jgi:peptide/nickel transport system substrate-binding protein
MEILTQAFSFITSFLIAIVPTSTYIEGVVGQPRSFLPSQTVTQTDRAISSLLYRGLFEYDIYGNIIPDLAETWSVSNDGLVYTIKLKDAQYWTNGRKISSDDLIYTSFQVQELNDVATDRVDDLTVRFTLPNKFSPFLSLLTVGIMPSNSEEADRPLDPVSSGKFRVLRVEKSGPVIKQIILSNTEDEEEISKLVFRYYANEDELFTAARLGEIDGFLSQETRTLENFTEYRYPLQGVYYALYFNLRDPKFEDVELRSKMEKVLPIEDLILSDGIAVQGPISRSIYTDKNLEFNKYDKDFSEDVGDITVTITVPDIETHTRMAKEIAYYWKNKLGITVEINKVDPLTFYTDVINERNYEILFYGQEVGRDPDRYVNWHSTQIDSPGLNLSGFSQVRAERALEEGRNEIDNDARMVHYHEFQKVLSEQVPAIFLYHPYSKYYVSKYVTGMGEKYTFSTSDRFLDFFNWKRVRVF